MGTGIPVSAIFSTVGKVVGNLGKISPLVSLGSTLYGFYKAEKEAEFRNQVIESLDRIEDLSKKIDEEIKNVLAYVKYAPNEPSVNEALDRISVFYKLVENWRRGGPQVDPDSIHAHLFPALAEHLETIHAALMGDLPSITLHNQERGTLLDAYIQFLFDSTPAAARKTSILASVFRHYHILITVQSRALIVAKAATPEGKPPSPLLADWLSGNAFAAQAAMCQKIVDAHRGNEEFLSTGVGVTKPPGDTLSRSRFCYFGRSGAIRSGNQVLVSWSFRQSSDGSRPHTERRLELTTWMGELGPDGLVIPNTIHRVEWNGSEDPAYISPDNSDYFGNQWYDVHFHCAAPKVPKGHVVIGLDIAEPWMINRGDRHQYVLQLDVFHAPVKDDGTVDYENVVRANAGKIPGLDGDRSPSSLDLQPAGSFSEYELGQASKEMDVIVPATNCRFSMTADTIVPVTELASLVDQFNPKGKFSRLTDGVQVGLLFEKEGLGYLSDQTSVEASAPPPQPSDYHIMELLKACELFTMHSHGPATREDAAEGFAYGDRVVLVSNLAGAYLAALSDAEVAPKRPHHEPIDDSMVWILENPFNADAKQDLYGMALVALRNVKTGRYLESISKYEGGSHGRVHLAATCSNDAAFRFDIQASK